MDGWMEEELWFETCWMVLFVLFLPSIALLFRIAHRLFPKLSCSVILLVSRQQQGWSSPLVLVIGTTIGGFMVGGTIIVCSICSCATRLFHPSIHWPGLYIVSFGHLI